METMNEKVAMVTQGQRRVSGRPRQSIAKAGATVVLVDINEPKEQVEKLVSGV